MSPPLTFLTPLKAGAVTPFSPTTWPNEFFFRADATSGGGTVSGWTDYSTNARNASLLAGTGWTKTTNNASVNNQPTAAGNNSGYYRYAADGTNILTNASTPFFTYGVMRYPNVATVNFQWFLTVGWYGDSLVHTAASNVSYAPLNTGLAASAGTNGTGAAGFTPSVGAWLTWIIAYNGGGNPNTPGNWTLYYNGTSYTPTAQGGLAIANVRNYWGARPNGTVPTTAEFAEVGCYKTTLTTALRNDLLGYWSSRYGL